MSMFRVSRLLLYMLLLAMGSTSLLSQAIPDLSGIWKQDNDRSQPKRSGSVMLRIEDHQPALSIETSIERGSAAARHAIQNYTTDGRVSISTGADGDEFHTSVVRKESTLIFSIEEHEDGRVMASKETWSIIEGGALIKRVRELANGGAQTIFYRRVTDLPNTKASNAQGEQK